MSNKLDNLMISILKGLAIFVALAAALAAPAQMSFAETEQPLYTATIQDL